MSGKGRTERSLPQAGNGICGAGAAGGNHRGEAGARSGGTPGETDRRALQLRHFDEGCDEEFEITRPHTCGKVYQFLIRTRFRAGLAGLGFEVGGRTVLEVCCGSGMMTEELAKRGGRVTGIDFSSAAILRARERCRRYGFHAAFTVADAECLPFPDGSFDVVAVYDGLHHMDDPAVGIREMARVARMGVMVLEPARAAVTRLAVWTGIAADVEEAGNYVRRLAAGNVAVELRSRGFERVKWERALMYYPHEPFVWLRWFDLGPLFLLFKAGFWTANSLLGRWGNKLALVATRGEGGSGVR